MSVRVLSLVLRHSQAKLGARLVLIALADAAHDDGVAWLDQDAIAAKANLSTSQTRRALRDLELMGEVETRKAQRGRRRINVYRVMLATEQPDYERLPFSMAEPFTTAQYERSSTADDRANPLVTTAQIRSNPASGEEEAYRETRAAMDLNRKGNRKKRSPKDGERAAVTAESTVQKERKPRKRDVVFDAMAEATNSDPQLEGSRIGVAVAKLRKHDDYLAAVDRMSKEAADELLAAQIPIRARAYRRRWPDISLTPTALVSNWKRVVEEQPAFRLEDVLGDDPFGLEAKYGRDVMDDALGPADQADEPQERHLKALPSGDDEPG
jgi:hypothetical protein